MAQSSYLRPDLDRLRELGVSPKGNKVHLMGRHLGLGRLPGVKSA